ncbi:unnamed protein product [marine sediment metagenome]|uniref:Uncharacterized protein n=1 Tax=marine sediment metagenome TaxID=412755 RepID=X1IR41_9ZZZZ
MSERTCKKCGTIDFDIWGNVALIGYSLIVVGLGYVLGDMYFSYAIPLVAVVFGIILWLPVFFINFHEEKEKRKNAEKNE